MRVDHTRPRRYPWWQLILIGLVGLVEAVFRPIGRMWRSEDPLDTYGLAHLGSVAGDAAVAIALAGSVFFELPVGEATGRVALYLVLTMVPLAIAGPFLVPLLDRAGPRRAISFVAALGRAVVCLYAAPRVDTLLLFPSALVLLVLAKVHGITRNGLAVAYAGPNEGLVRANARLGRIGVGGAILGAAPALALLKLGGATAALYGAAATYGVAAFLNLRLPHPHVPSGPAEVSRRGAIPQLAAPAIGAAGLRAASGFLLFALAFALRRGGEPTWWFGVLAAAATAGGYFGNVIAPRLPSSMREEAVVVASIATAGVGAIVAFVAFTLPVLTVFALVVGATTELGRLAFQTLMQRLAPGGAHGRVFVRYEVMFQLAWVGGALIPAVVPIDLRGGFLILAALYLVAGVGYLTPDLVARRRSRGSG
ncbi:MAG TPA: hypothetical protein VFK59_09095 [Actinomycetota bacterium]|nr:hypothetical protein [Actinomycetota bacterium]